MSRSGHQNRTSETRVSVDTQEIQRDESLSKRFKACDGTDYGISQTGAQPELDASSECASQGFGGRRDASFIVCAQNDCVTSDVSSRGQGNGSSKNKNSNTQNSDRVLKRTLSFSDVDSAVPERKKQRENRDSVETQ